MRIAANTVSEVHGDISDATEMTINLDSFAFEALSGDKLYKNLIRAIVRELSCNAYDAHVMADTQDQPFAIHLPTMLEPFFSIRDFGIGLDDAGVRKTYLTYFGSSKRQDNKTTGAWGLGSKSPLGYSDNFTITSYKDGMGRMYCVFKNPENGIPSVTKLSEFPTTERNGLLVQVPVINDNDTRVFIRETMNVLEWFPVAPIINTDDKLNTHEYDMRDIIKGAHLRKGDANHYGSRCVAIMGNIEYPIHFPNTDMLDPRVTELVRYPFELHFALGELKFSMSREELGYNAETVKAINDKMVLVSDALIPRMEATIKDMSEWNKAVFLEQKSRDYNHVLKTPASTMIEKGMSKVHTAFESGTLGFEGGIGDDLLKTDGIKISSYEKSKHHNRKIGSVIKLTANYLRHDKDGTGYGMVPSDAILFIINDEPKRSLDRIKAHIAETGYRSIVMFSMIDASKDIGAVEIACIEKTLETLGNPPVIRVSETAPAIKRVVDKSKVVSKGDVLVLYRNTKNEGKWDGLGGKDFMETDGKHIYVELFNTTVLNCGNMDTDSLMRLEAAVNNAVPRSQDKVLKIHGVRKGGLEAVKADKKWVHLLTYINELAVAHKDSFILEQKMSNISGFLRNKVIADGLATDAEFADLVSIRSIWNKDTFKEHGRELISILSSMKVLDLDKEGNLVQDMCSKFFKKYPMLNVYESMSAWQYESKKELPAQFMEYMKAVQVAHTLTSTK